MYKEVWRVQKFATKYRLKFIIQSLFRTLTHNAPMYIRAYTYAYIRTMKGSLKNLIGALGFCQLVSVCTYVRAQAQKNNPLLKHPLIRKVNNQSYSPQLNENEKEHNEIKGQ